MDEERASMLPMIAAGERRETFACFYNYVIYGEIPSSHH